MFYGVLAADGRFVYANAGHNPPVVLSRTGVRRLTAGGPMLGVFDEVQFPEETVSLHQGETLVLFSDGVTEARNAAGEEFSEARLVACLEERRDQQPRAILSALVERVGAFCGDALQSDDLTTVVLRFR
jgi:sigma-B regulation protein RsbU (phosphoserine phosphatase)